MLQLRVGYIEKEEMLGRVYRKTRQMLQACWVGCVEKEEECYKPVGQGI